MTNMVKRSCILSAWQLFNDLGYYDDRDDNNNKGVVFFRGERFQTKKEPHPHLTQDFIEVNKVFVICGPFYASFTLF